MKIPNFLDIRLVDEKGFITDEWRQILEQLFQQLQKNVGDEGFVVSSQTATNIALLNLVNGTIIYDSTSNEFKGMKAGTLQKFTLVP